MHISQRRGQQLPLVRLCRGRAGLQLQSYLRARAGLRPLPVRPRRGQAGPAASRIWGERKGRIVEDDKN